MSIRKWLENELQFNEQDQRGWLEWVFYFLCIELCPPVIIETLFEACKYFSEKLYNLSLNIIKYLTKH